MLVPKIALKDTFKIIWKYLLRRKKIPFVLVTNTKNLPKEIILKIVLIIQHSLICIL